jgi:hypothetical protein
MSIRKKVDLDLTSVLVVVAGLELALNRLAVPVLRPPGAQVPSWHRDIDLAGLFSFHLATALALLVGIHKTWELFFARRDFSFAMRAMVGLAGAAFFGLAIWGIFFRPPPMLSFHLESSLTLVLLLLALALAVRPGDPRVKLGMIILTLPFLLHYYGTFALRLLVPGDAVRGSPLPDQIRNAGQWSVALAAIGVALCFAPRPLWRSIFKPGPLAIAGFTGTILAVILVRHQDVGMELASRGLGIELTPGPPAPIVIAFVLAGAAVVWSLASTLTSVSPARRTIGMGLALVCIGGYAFSWPLTMLTVVAGALAVVDGGLRLGPVESPGPQVPLAAWRAYLGALAAELDAELAGDTLRGRRDGLPFALRLDAAQPHVEIAFGELPDGPPALTVAARPEKILGGRGHPPPPDTPAPHRRTGDLAFDERFRLHAEDDLGELLDDGLRARAAAVLDGWIAVWRNGALRYEIFPGRGAPLDHPLPLTELRAGEPASPQRMLRVFDLLAEIAARAQP